MLNSWKRRLTQLLNHSLICKLLRIYIYIAMCIKLVFVIKFYLNGGDINYLLGELVAWTIILVSPICDALLQKSFDNK